MKLCEAADLAEYLVKLFPLISAERAALAEKYFDRFGDPWTVRDCIDRHRESFEHLNEPALYELIRARDVSAAVERASAAIARSSEFRSAEQRSRDAAESDRDRVLEQLRLLTPKELDRRKAAVLAQYDAPASVKSVLARVDPLKSPVLGAMVAAYGGRRG